MHAKGVINCWKWLSS